VKNYVVENQLQNLLVHLCYLALRKKKLFISGSPEVILVSLTLSDYCNVVLHVLIVLGSAFLTIHIL